MNRAKLILLCLALGFAALDQLSKDAMRTLLASGEPLAVIPNVFQLKLTYNSGAAFSLLRDQPQILTLITVVIFLALLAYGMTRKVFLKGELPALALILGGALGNLLDRLLAGRVTDFLDLVVIRYPVFNLADTFIFCGVAWLVWLQLRAPETPVDERSV